MFFSERTGLQKLLLLKAAAGGSVVEDTATGNPLTFLTDLARPLKSLLIPFTPKQTGSGDPSPQNVRPIVPWNGLNILIEAGTKAPTETDISFPSPVYGGEHEAVSGKLMDGWAVKVFDGSLDELWDKISIGSASAFAMQIQISGKSTSADSYMCDSLKNIARNATWGNYDNWISDNQNSIVTGIKTITTVADWRAYLAEHPITVAYKLATPQEITLTPEQITALKGENTIWSDADGSMTAIYYKKG